MLINSTYFFLMALKLLDVRHSITSSKMAICCNDKLPRHVKYKACSKESSVNLWSLQDIMGHNFLSDNLTRPAAGTFLFLHHISAVSAMQLTVSRECRRSGATVFSQTTSQDLQQKPGPGPIIVLHCFYAAQRVCECRTSGATISCQTPLQDLSPVPS